MKALLIELTAQSDRFDELLAFLRWDAEVAATEPGTLRFDVYEIPDRPGCVYVYEAYADDAAFDAHRAGEPFRAWVDHVEREVVASKRYLLDRVVAVATDHGED